MDVILKDDLEKIIGDLTTLYEKVESGNAVVVGSVSALNKSSGKSLDEIISDKVDEAIRSAELVGTGKIRFFSLPQYNYNQDTEILNVAGSGVLKYFNLRAHKGNTGNNGHFVKVYIDGNLAIGACKAGSNGSIAVKLFNTSMTAGVNGQTPPQNALPGEYFNVYFNNLQELGYIDLGTGGEVSFITERGVRFEKSLRIVLRSENADGGVYATKNYVVYTLD